MRTKASNSMTKPNIHNSPWTILLRSFIINQQCQTKNKHCKPPHKNHSVFFRTCRILTAFTIPMQFLILSISTIPSPPTTKDDPYMIVVLILQIFHQQASPSYNSFHNPIPPTKTGQHVRTNTHSAWSEQWLAYLQSTVND